MPKHLRLVTRNNFAYQKKQDENQIKEKFLSAMTIILAVFLLGINSIIWHQQSSELEPSGNNKIAIKTN